VAEFQGLALTPPATLSFLAFQGKEFDNFLDKEAALALAFCLVGMGIYGVGAAVLYGLGNERFRQQNRRRREGLPHRPADERWTQPILSAEPAEDPAAPPNPPDLSERAPDGS